MIDADSVEIRWHHSPSVRLTVHGTSISGVEQPTGALPLLFIIFERARPLTGEVVPCTATSDRWPNDSWTEQEIGRLRFHL